MNDKEAVYNLNHIYGLVSPDIQRSLDVAMKAIERKPAPDDRLVFIAEHYGLKSQLSILQEECAELIQAASKYVRGFDVHGLLEEIADTQIMLEQVRYLLNSDATIESIKDSKIKRQLDRIEGENNE